jgi:hypothetical protein
MERVKKIFACSLISLMIIILLNACVSKHIYKFLTEEPVSSNNPNSYNAYSLQLALREYCKTHEEITFKEVMNEYKDKEIQYEFIDFINSKWDVAYIDFKMGNGEEIKKKYALNGELIPIKKKGYYRLAFCKGDTVVSQNGWWDADTVFDKSTEVFYPDTVFVCTWEEKIVPSEFDGVPDTVIRKLILTPKK